jgi:hypothetical protein
LLTIAQLTHPIKSKWLGDRLANLRTNARETILKHYNLTTLLTQHIQWLLGQLESSKLSRDKGFAVKSQINQPALNLKYPAFT